jgi:CHASE2 domain-containing sensor protein
MHQFKGERVKKRTEKQLNLFHTGRLEHTNVWSKELAATLAIAGIVSIGAAAMIDIQVVKVVAPVAILLLVTAAAIWKRQKN